MTAHSRPKCRSRCAAIFLLAPLAALVTVAICGCGSGSAPRPKAAAPLSAHAREVAAMTAWSHGDGDMLYVQTEQALSAFQKAEESGSQSAINTAAVTLWQDAGITLHTPPPVGTAQWTTALRDLEHAAQLAGGDPGARTGTDAQVLRWLRRFDRHITAASAEIAALSH